MKKIISIILCIALLLSTVAFAETGADISCACGDTHVSNCPNNTCLNCGATGGVHATDCPLRPFLADIGNYAEFNSAYNNFPIIGYHPSGIDSGDAFHSDNIVEFDPASVPAVKIADVALSSDGDSCWYKLEAVAGIPLPDNFPEEPWVFQDYITYPGGASLIVHKPAGGNNIYEQDPEAEPLMMSKSSGKGSAADCECPMTNGLHYATCDYYICPNCGLGPWKHEIEDCPMLADIGKVAEINPDAYDLILVATADEPDENWEEDYMPFDPTDFSADILFFIDDYKIVTQYVSGETVAEMAEGEETNTVDELRSIWYEVHVVKGTAPEDFEEGYWILQNYVGVNADPYDVLILREADQCPACGEYDCDIEHVWCDICGKYDCGEEHEDEPACGCCDACTGAEGCECGCDNCEFAPEDDGELDEDGVITGTVTDAEGNPVLDGSGDPLLITVTGDAIPKGAEVVASIPEINDETTDVEGFGVFDIKVQDSENCWQPNPGETVRVSIPVLGDFDTVNVVHFLEDPATIIWALDNDVAVLFECPDIPAEYAHIFAPAIAAYQTACGTDKVAAVIEGFANVPVVDGVATVDAHGFSVFINNGTSQQPVYVETTQTGITTLDNNNQTLYVRPGDWVRLTAGGGLSANFIFTNGSKNILGRYTSISTPEYLSVLNQRDGWLVDSSSYYFRVSDDASVGSTFKVALNSILTSDSLWGSYMVAFEVIEDFEYDKTRVCVVPHSYDGYPVELSEFNASVGYSYYTAESTLSATNSIYSTLPSDLINVDALQSSDKYLSNTELTVYGMVDTTGVSTTAYLNDTFNNTVAPDILAEFCAANGLNAEDYHLVAYTIKYEAIGNNVGWYIICKVVRDDSYLLHYNYNYPKDFTQFTIVGSPILPSDKYVTPDSEGVVTENIGPFSAISLSREEKNGNQTQTFTAELVGWSASQYTTADAVEYKVGSQSYQLTMDGSTTLYAIWRVTSGNLEYSDFDWTIRNSSVNAINNPISSDISFNYAIDVGDNYTFPQSYAVYDSSGAFVRDGTFTPETIDGKNFLTFSITGNQYIVIEDVTIKKNSNTDYVYTAEQTNVPNGFELLTSKITVSSAATKQFGLSESLFENKRLAYDLTYDLDGGAVEVANPTFYHVESGAITLNNPTREGYTFLGWTGSNGSAPQLTVTIPAGSTGNKNYTANWEKNEYTITWNANGGEFSDNSTTKTTTVEHGTVPTAPGNPSKADTAQYDYSFSGWEPEVVAATGDATYTARYNAETKTYTVTWKNYDGTVLETDENVPYGTTPTYDGEKPAKSNTQQYSYTFAGWSPTVSEVTGDAVYTATFTETVNKYTITWMVDGKKTTETYEYGATPEFKGSTYKPSDARYSYSFAGWNPSISVVIGDTTYTATYNRTPITYSISYTLNGGTVAGVNPTEYNVETPTFTLTNPTKTGYTFKGWTGSNGDTPQTTVTITSGSTGNKSYTANWEAVTYTISYDLAGGSVSGNPTSYTIESSAITLTNPTRTGYTFAGWTGTGLDSAAASVTIAAGSIGNRSYTATWTPITYTITYDLAGGSVSGTNPASYTIESTDITLNNPTKTGYIFAGWTGTGLAEATTNVTIATGSIGDRTYTATWEVETYTITYKGLEGAEVSANPTTYTIETATFTLNNPTKAGYTFEGWTGTDLSGATATVIVEKGSTGDREYTATWKEAYADLTITASGADDDQTFIYVISGKPDDTATHGATITLTVAVPAGQKVVIKDLPVGKYTVTEQSDWNWRYENKSEPEFNFTVAGKQIEFKYGAVTTDKWLNDYFRKRGKGAGA